MKKPYSIINAISTKFLTPFLLCFALYVQIFGEITPGGGFQAGILFSSTMIAYDLSIAKFDKNINSLDLLRYGTFGMLIYFSAGIFGLIFNCNFLNYEVLDVKKILGFSGEKFIGQQIGITLVELGIALTVGSILLLIYREIKNAH